MAKADGTFTKRNFANQTTVLIDSAPRFRSVAYAVCLLGGVRDEKFEKVGLTHMLEHLLFKQTSKYSPARIASIIDEFGGEMNAFTDVDSLCLHGVVPGDRQAELYEFFADLVLDPQITDEYLTTEQEVVRQEILESEDSPADAIYRKFYEEFWPGSPLGWPVFGYPETVPAITVADLTSRLKAISSGRRLVVAAAGSVDIPLLYEHVERRYGHLPKGTELPSLLAVPKQGVVTLDLPTKQVHIVLGANFPSSRSEDYLPAMALTAILGQGGASRLFRSLRETHGLAYDVDADLQAYREAGVLMLSAVVERKHLRKALDVIAKEVINFAAEPPTADELERVLKMYHSQIVMEEDRLSGRLWRALESEINLGMHVSAAELAERVSDIKRDKIVEVIEKYLLPKKYLLAIGGNVNEKSVAQSNILELTGPLVETEAAPKEEQTA